LLNNWGYVKRIEKGLESRSWSKKLEALHFTTVFEIIELKPSVKALFLHDTNSFVKIRAFRTLSVLGNIDDLEEMIQFIEMYRNDRYRQTIIIELLNNLEIETSQLSYKKMKQLYESVETTIAKTCLLHLFARKLDGKWAEFILEQTNNDDPEIQIAILKSLIYIGEFSEALFSEKVRSSNQQVRIVSLKAHVLMNNEANLELFEHYLRSDENWWMKYYAAFGLATLGKEGRANLERIANSKRDSVASSFARYFLQILGEEVYVWEMLQRSLKE
jgi:hypothetical protein